MSTDSTEELASAATDKAKEESKRKLSDIVPSLGESDDFSFVGLLTHTEPHEPLEELHSTEWIAHYYRAAKKAIDYLIDKEAMPLQKTLAADLIQGTRKWYDQRDVTEESDDNIPAE